MRTSFATFVAMALCMVSANALPTNQMGAPHYSPSGVVINADVKADVKAAADVKALANVKANADVKANIHRRDNSYSSYDSSAPSGSPSDKSSPSQKNSPPNGNNGSGPSNGGITADVKAKVAPVVAADVCVNIGGAPAPGCANHGSPAAKSGPAGGAAPNSGSPAGSPAGKSSGPASGTPSNGLSVTVDAGLPSKGAAPGTMMPNPGNKGTMMPTPDNKGTMMPTPDNKASGVSVAVDASIGADKAAASPMDVNALIVALMVDIQVTNKRYNETCASSCTEVNIKAWSAEVAAKIDARITLLASLTADNKFSKPEIVVNVIVQLLLEIQFTLHLMITKCGLLGLVASVANLTAALVASLGHLIAAVSVHVTVDLTASVHDLMWNTMGAVGCILCTCGLNL